MSIIELEALPESLVNVCSLVTNFRLVIKILACE